MRFFVIVLLFVPTVAWSRPLQQAPTSASAPAEIAPPIPSDVIPDDRATPLGASQQAGGRILNKNEAYNLGRAAEGRVGVRLGNDMSYRITGN